jgi:hypothetical protein
MPSPLILAPSDYKLVAAARKRGGPKAAERVTNAIARRAVASQGKRDELRKALMADDADHAWPPPMLIGGR